MISLHLEIVKAQYASCAIRCARKRESIKSMNIVEESFVKSSKYLQKRPKEKIDVRMGFKPWKIDGLKLWFYSDKNSVVPATDSLKYADKPRKNVGKEEGLSKKFCCQKILQIKSLKWSS